MAGVKGRSGRKSLLDEKTRARIIRMSAAIIYKYYRNPNISLKEKAAIANEIFKRQVPNITEEQGNAGIIYNTTVIDNFVPALKEVPKIEESPQIVNRINEEKLSELQ